VSLSLLSYQNAILLVSPNPADTVTNLSATVDNPGLLDVQPSQTYPNGFVLTALGQNGTANVTVSGINSQGNAVSTVFPVTITTPAPVVASSFTGSLTQVQHN
jgi:hypothetical protein